MSEPSEQAQRVQQLIASRRTVFQFEDRPVAAEVLERALQAAHWAPNHKHTWPWRFLVPGPQMRAQLEDYFAGRLELKLQRKGVPTEQWPERLAASRARQAKVPAQLIVYTLQEGDDTRRREDYASACCAIQNLSLALWAEGVASGWKTFDSPEAYALTGLDPEQVALVGLIQIGYPLKQSEGKRPPLAEHVIYTA